MFVHDFTYVEAPVAELRDRVLALLVSGDDRVVGDAYADGVALLTRVGPSDLPLLRKQVEATVGVPRQRADGAVLLPIRWVATGTPVLFPQLDGELEVAPLGATRTQVSLLGHYTPPLGGVGARLDTLLLHRIAEATVRSFLTRLAAAVAVGDPAPPSVRLETAARTRLRPGPA